MKLWWLIDSSRLAAERAAVESAVTEGWFSLTRWHLVEGRLAVDGVITAHDAEYPVRLLYPDLFPSVPAWVEPLDPETHWSAHQYGRRGTLCLELRPDNWDPSATGGDVLRSAFNLLRTENPLGSGVQGTVPSAHHVGAIQAYDTGTFPVLIGQGCLGRIKDGTATDVRALRWHSEDAVWPILVYDSIDAQSAARPLGPDPAAGRQELPVFTARGEPLESSPSSRRELSERLGLDLESCNIAGPILALAVGNDEVTPLHSTDSRSVFLRKLVVLRDDSGVRSGNAATAPPKRVAIVGVGSVGSKIAETLIRAGVSRLVLVDGDVMLPGNLERHVLDWRDVGFRKVNAVRRRLLNIRPGAEVITVAENLNWQRSARRQAVLMDAIASCDLIVDATGDVPTSLLVGAVAADNRKPFVSVEVLEGGIGCVIARSVPGLDATYSQGRVGLSAYCEEQAVEPPDSGPRAYEAFGEDGTIVVADDAAVAVAAAHTARAVIDLLHAKLDEDSPAWLLIGLRRGWIFSGHGNTIGLHAPHLPGLVKQNDPSDPGTAERAREFALSLLQEVERADTSPE